MSVWPKTASAGPSLSGSQGDLVSVSICVKPRDLESLLESLALVPFPINPEIYHDAAMVYRYGDGRESEEDATLVEFPAYASRLEEVRDALEARGFDRSSLHVTSMLDEIQTELATEPPPAAPYVSCRHLKRRRTATVH